MTFKKIYTIDDITDEHLIDFIDGEINDQDLYEFIKNSSVLKSRLDSYKKTHNLVNQLEVTLEMDEGLDNYSHITEATKSSDYSGSNLNWLNKLKVNGASILLDQPLALNGLVAAILVAAAFYLNIQNPTPEWQARYNALGYDSEFIDTSDWPAKANEAVVYSLPNNNNNEVTVNIASGDTIDDLVASGSAKEIIQPTAIDKELANIDARLTSKFLTGVLLDMHSKKIVTGKLSQVQK
ncbi:MAG: hypothetical protein ACJ0HZ_06540 [Woeseiaceae bacterium]